MIALWVIIGIIVILFFVFIGIYNGLSGCATRQKMPGTDRCPAKEAHDLIPIWLKVLKVYAA